MEPITAFAVIKDGRMLLHMISENQPDLENDVAMLNEVEGGYRVVPVEVREIERATVN